MYICKCIFQKVHLHVSVENKTIELQVLVYTPFDFDIYKKLLVIHVHVVMCHCIMVELLVSLV